jgi:hypothetical protein
MVCHFMYLVSRPHIANVLFTETRVLRKIDPNCVAYVDEENSNMIEMQGY